MSRRLLIGFIAALAVLASTPAGLAQASSSGTSGFMLSSIGASSWATFPSSFHIHVNPFQIRVDGGDTLLGYARCNDGTVLAMVIMPDPGIKAPGSVVRGFDRGYLSPYVKAMPGATCVVWDPNCSSGCTVRGLFAKVIGNDGTFRGFTKYTMFLPLAFKDCTGPYGLVAYHEGDTATHEAWQAHQPCTVR
jgi:hypothetical protein